LPGGPHYLVAMLSPQPLTCFTTWAGHQDWEAWVVFHVFVICLALVVFKALVVCRALVVLKAFNARGTTDLLKALNVSLTSQTLDMIRIWISVRL
jgi:hypothetical protein